MPIMRDINGGLLQLDWLTSFIIFCGLRLCFTFQRWTSTKFPGRFQPLQHLNIP